jgi:pilus assembly protein TadC
MPMPKRAGEAPVQGQSQQKKRGPLAQAAEIIAQQMPDLRGKLRMAEMDDDPVPFLEKTLAASLAVSGCLIVLAYLFTYQGIADSLSRNLLGAIVMILWPPLLIPLGVFRYLLLYPEAMLIKRQRELDYEIVFAGRHIAIALKSGMPLFDTFVGASSGYGAVSREFGKIVDKVVLGVPVAQAIRDVTDNNPSKYFNRMLIQVSNSVSSGADVGSSLESVLDQISKEQMIALKEYSQKLTPIVMFYMIFGIIVPSLGIVLATVVFSAISGGKFGFSSSLLVVAFFLIAVVQFLFLGFAESARPKYLL